MARSVGAQLAVIGDPACYPELKEALAGSGIEAAAGAEAVVEAALRPAEWVMAGIVGAAGLRADPGRGAAAAPWWRWPTRSAWSAPAPCSWMRCARHGATLLPVDSEHNAIWQALAGSDRAGVRRADL